MKSFHMYLEKLTQRLHYYSMLMRLDRPIGIYLLLWPTLAALWIAGDGKPDPLVLTVFALGVVLMRSAGCVINDYADRHIDPQVRRTARRPLAAGRVKPAEALVLFALLCLAAFGLVLLLNPFTIALSVVGVLLAATYPFAKRYTYLPQVHLGVAFGWAVPMAFAAQAGGISSAGWLLFIATVLWAVIYDTMYAMVDRADDLRIGVKSTAILFGDADRIIIGGMQVTLLIVLVILGRHLHFTTPYYLGVLGAAVFALYQQYLIKDRDPENCLHAFLNNHWFGLVIFCGILLHYVWK